MNFKNLIKTPKKGGKSDVSAKICARCYNALVTEIKGENTT